METKKLNEILKKHSLWLANMADGQVADLQSADLHGADLRGADLRRADLWGANLQGADLDFACLPLWCGGLKMQIDDRIAKQLLYHLLSNVKCSKNISNDIKQRLLTADIVDIANTSHVVTQHNCTSISYFDKEAE